MYEGTGQTLRKRETPSAELSSALWRALEAYTSGIHRVSAKPYHDEEGLREVTEEFYTIANSVRTYGIPKDEVERISLGFIEHALDFESPLPVHEREAAANLGLSVGKDFVDETIADYLKDRHDEFEKNSGTFGTTNQPAAIAEVMLNALGYERHDEIIGSYAEDAARLTRELSSNFVKAARSQSDNFVSLVQDHKKTAAMGGVAAVTAIMLLAPTAANAAEAAPSSQATSVSSSEINVLIANPTTENQSTAESTKTTTTKPKQATDTPTMIIGDTFSSDSKTAEAAAITSIAPETEASAPQGSVIIGDTIAKTPNAAPITAVSAPEAAAPVNVKVVVSAPTPVAVSADSTSTGSAPATQNPAPTAITSAPETAPSPETSATLSPDQKNAQFIQSLINNNGDISTAASMIQSDFRTELNKDADGNPIYAASNVDLLTNVLALKAKLMQTVGANGHSDANYVNTAYMAMAVLSAATNDRTVLDSPNVQAMVANVKRPAGEYQGKLFDQNMANVKKTMGDNSALFADFSDAEMTEFAQLSAYTEMASSSDADQAKQMNDIKSAEAAATAAAQTSKETANSQSPEAESLNDLINGATNTTAKNEYIAVQFFVNHGYSIDQAYGILGNLMRESASTMDPGINQYGGPAHGIAQWEGDRFNNTKGGVGLVQYAAAQGKPWQDLGVQLNFILWELNNTEQGANSAIKAAQNQYDATHAWLTEYERPRVVLDGYQPAIDDEAKTRMSRAQGARDAFNSTLNTVTQQRAAAVKAAQDAAKRIADQKVAQEAEQQKEAQGQSFKQKLVATAQAELAKWTNGSYRPIANGGNGISSYLDYSDGVHTNWCAYFVSTMIDKAGGNVPGPNNKQGVVSDVKSQLLSTGNYTWHDAGTYVPQAGDIAFYGQGYSHINIVTAAGSGTHDYTSIGGNEGNGFVPGYAQGYTSKDADSYGGTHYDQSFVVQEVGSDFGGEAVGFLSPNN